MDGTIDLREADFTRPVRLNGEWRAQSAPDGSSRAAYDLDDTDWKRVSVPGSFQKQGFPDEGLVWYRVRLLLPKDVPPLTGYLKYARNATAVYAATADAPPRVLGASGEATHSAATTRLSRRPFTFVLPADSAVVLSWKVANYDYLRGGVPLGIVLGTPSVMHQWIFRGEVDTLLIAGLYLMLMLFFGGYWQWNRRDYASLAVSLLSLVTMLRAVVVEGTFELVLGSAVTFQTRIVLEAITFFLLPGLTLLTVWSLYPKEYLPVRLGRFAWSPPGDLDESALRSRNTRQKPPLSHFWRKLNTVVLVVMTAVGVLFSTISLFADTSVITYMLSAFRGLTLAMIAVTPITLFQIVERRRPMAGVMFTAFSIIMITALHDILLSQGVITGGFYVAPYGLLAFLLLQGYMVAHRSAQNAHIVRHHAMILEAEVSRQTRSLKAAMIASEAANAAKTQFLNAVSHEIRTPLTSIIGFTQILEEELQEKATQQDLEFVHLIRDSGDRLLRLVNDLLDLAKIETGRIDLEVRDVSLGSVVSDVIRQSFPVARSRSLTLTATPAVNEFSVRADAMRLHQVLLNLVTNGLKFTEEGGVTISADQAVLGGPDEKGRPAVAIRVADTGCGMSREFLPHVFDRFTQELRAYHSTIRGTGLGLALSRELVLRMNGRIEVESELGQGSQFTVTLPLAAASTSSPDDGPIGDGAAAQHDSHPEVGRVSAR